jgi:hypothetical protein
MERQKLALEAHAVLYSLFTINYDGSVSYPNDFAGVWIEDFKYLHIATTSSLTRSTFIYEALLEDFGCIVVFENAEHSLNMLSQLRDIVFDTLTDAGLPVVYGYVSASRNRVYIGLSELGEIDVVDVLVQNNTSLSRVFNRNIFEDVVVFGVTSLIQQERELRGGDWMDWNGHNTTDSRFKTIGVNGAPGRFITSGHGLWEGRRLYHFGHFIGTVNRVFFQPGIYGDFAIVNVTNHNLTQSNRVLGGASGGNRNITGIVSNAPEGTMINNFGAASGYRIAVVRDPNVIVNGARGMTRAELIMGSSTGSDSGSPWHTSANLSLNQWNLVGIHHGSDVAAGGRIVVFTPTVRFLPHFTPMTR